MPTTKGFEKLYLALMLIHNCAIIYGTFEDSIVFTRKSENHVVIIPGTPYDIHDSISILSGSLVRSFTTLNVTLTDCDVNYRENTLYVYDQYTASIIEIQNFDWKTTFSNFTDRTLHSDVSRDWLSIAVDWVSNNVYWTDPMYKWIALQPGLAGDIDMTNYKIIVHEDLENPRSLAVDPINEYLFWSDVGMTKAIERSGLIGEYRQVIVSQGLGWVTGMTVDLPEKRIIWIDSIRDTIESADYNGQNRRIIRRMVHTTFRDISIYRDTLLVTEKDEKVMLTFNKTNGETLNLLTSNSVEIYSVCMYSADNQPNKTNNCASSPCDHICVSTSSGHTCLCKEGYELRNSVCTESNTNRAMIMTNNTHVCLFDIRVLASGNTSHVCPFQPSSTIDFMDIDMEEKTLVFAADMEIYSVNLIANVVEQLITTSTESITGLCLDWTDKNIYWTSGTSSGSINVFSQQSNSDLILVSNLVYPRDIIILPLDRKMVWITGVIYSYKVMKADIDGTHISTVVDSDLLTNPQALIVDHIINTLYWTDNNHVKTCNWDGTGVRQINSYANKLKFPNLLLVYKNHLVVTEDSGSVSTVNSLRIGSATYQRRHYKTQRILGKITHIAVIDPAVQPNVKGPCDTLNGDCEHICIPIGQNRLCKCEYGFTLDDNRESCFSNPVFDNFVLVTDWTHNKIYQVALESGEVRGLDTSITGSPSGIAYNHVTKTVIWGDTAGKNIHSVEINGSNARIIGETGNYSSYPDGLAVDFTSGNIFYTFVDITPADLGYSGIGVISPSGDHRLLIKYHEKPRDIVIDPSEGLMFWTDYSVPFVRRAHMDGTSEQTIITNNIKEANGLAIEYKTKMLYLADGSLDTIQRCTYGGSCTLYHADSGAHLMDIALLDDYLYYTAWNRPYITRLHKSNSGDVSRLAVQPELGRLDGLALYKSSSVTQPSSTSCSANHGLGECSTFCLPTSTGFTCACEDDVELLSDGKTCSNKQIPTSTSPTTESLIITDLTTTTFQPSTPSTKDTTTAPSGDNNTPESKKNNLTIPIAVGAGAGGLILIVVIIILVVVLVCRRSDRQQQNDNSNNQQELFHIDLSSAYRGPNPVEPMRDSTYTTIDGDLVNLRNKETKNKTDNNTTSKFENQYVSLIDSQYERLGTAPRPPTRKGNAGQNISDDTHTSANEDYLHPITDKRTATNASSQNDSMHGQGGIGTYSIGSQELNNPMYDPGSMGNFWQNQSK